MFIYIERPGWYHNNDFVTLFTTREVHNQVTSNAPLTLAPGLGEVLAAITPQLDEHARAWAVYGIVLEKHNALVPPKR